MKKNRIEFAETEIKNIDQIKKIWKCFFNEINKIDLAIEYNEITPIEIFNVVESFERKFDIIKHYARAEINKRKDDDKKTV